MREIFKLQWPIIGDTVLVYNKDRSTRGEIPQTQSLADLFIEHDTELHMKLYVRGHIDTKGKLCIDSEEPDAIIPFEEWPEW